MSNSNRAYEDAKEQYKKKLRQYQKLTSADNERISQLQSLLNAIEAFDNASSSASSSASLSEALLRVQRSPNLKGFDENKQVENLQKCTNILNNHSASLSSAINKQATLASNTMLGNAKLAFGTLLGVAGVTVIALTAAILLTGGAAAIPIAAIALVFALSAATTAAGLAIAHNGIGELSQKILETPENNQSNINTIKNDIEIVKNITAKIEEEIEDSISEIETIKEDTEEDIEEDIEDSNSISEIEIIKKESEAIKQNIKAIEQKIEAIQQKTKATKKDTETIYDSLHTLFAATSKSKQSSADGDVTKNTNGITPGAS